MIRLATTSTLKMLRAIGEKEVFVYTNLGVTHNFIFIHIVWELQLLVNKTISYNVVIENSMKTKGCRVCMRVELSMQGLRIIDSFLLL